MSLLKWCTSPFTQVSPPSRSDQLMSETAILINTAVAVLATVLLIVRFKVNPVISLVLGSLYLGLSTGLGITKTIETITGGFGEIMVEVGLLIAFGVLMGSILNETGAIR